MNNRSSRPLSALGISELEEDIYDALLEHGEATLEELASVLGRAPDGLRPALSALDRLGLVTHSLQQPRQYIPISPSIALEALIYRRQKELERARAEAVQMQKRMRVDQPSDEQQIVELITSPEAERRIFEQMQSTVREEMLFLVRQPLRVSPLLGSQTDRMHEQALARGVRYRRLADAEFIDQAAEAGGMQSLLDALGTTDQIRVTSELPFKMVLADRHSALIPLSLGDAHGPALLVRSAAMLDALYTLFELLWERAAPLRLLDGSRHPEVSPEAAPDGEAKTLVQLLASGLNDKLIASEMGVSRSTLDRRMQALRESLGARTRFQAGWQAARQWQTALDDALPSSGKCISKTD